MQLFRIWVFFSPLLLKSTSVWISDNSKVQSFGNKLVPDATSPWMIVHDIPGMSRRFRDCLALIPDKSAQTEAFGRSSESIAESVPEERSGPQRKRIKMEQSEDMEGQWSFESVQVKQESADFIREQSQSPPFFFAGDLMKSEPFS